MKEEIVRRVMIEYFKSRGWEVVPQKGAGPDLHIKERGIVEVKGTTFDFSRMLKQLVDYVKKYPEVRLALPFDGVNYEQAEQMNALATMIKEIETVFKLYVVAPAANQDNVFYVLECYDISQMLSLLSFGVGHHGFDVRKANDTIDKVVEDLINYSPKQEALHQIYVLAGINYNKITKIQI
jgi:hypothetical protein